IKILEDTNGDGRADKVTVFADGLNIPTSMTFANGGLIVAMAPHFIFLKDTNGDGKADVREKIMTGWGKNDTHAGPSNLKYGLDNKVWGVLGYAGFNGNVSGKDLTFGQGLYNFDPNGENLEYLGRTSNNTWGLGFSEEFDVFISTANGLHSAYFAMPNKYVKRSVAGGSGNTVHRIDSHYDMPHVTPYLRQVDWHGGYTAAAGHNIYTARSFPKSYWNRVGLVAEPTGRVLHNVILNKKGAGYVEENGFNLLASSDEWFSPVHAEVGPDGAVWVADWYNFIIQHNPTPRGFENGDGNAYINPLRDSRHGRIYRVVYKGAKAYKPVQLDRNDPKSLIEGLKNDNMFWRTTAQRLIVESKDKDIVPRLYSLVNDKSVDELGLNSPVVHALWTLHGLGALDGSDRKALAVAMEALKHPSAGVRKNAIQVLPRNTETVNKIIEAKLLDDPDLRTRMAAVLAIADTPGSPDVGRLLYEASGKKENAEDEYLPQAFFAAAITYQDSYLQAAGTRDVNVPDSLMSLSDRLIKSMSEEQYVLDRWTPILFPPDVTQKEITIRASMSPSDDGLEGVVVAQGDNNFGYSLYIQNNQLNWVVRQNGETYKAISRSPLPKERFDVIARLAEGGEMTILVNDAAVGKGKAPSLFNQPITTERIRVGFDVEEHKVGNHPDRFRFVGNLQRNGSLALKNPNAALVSNEINANAALENPTQPAKTDRSAGSITINLNVVEHEMKFDKESISVKAGQEVTLHFENQDFMQHNFLLLQKGSLEKVGKAADELARDPKGADQNYVPKMKEVIIATKLVNPEGRETLIFTAPTEPGEYPFVCTVPGHWRLMNGVMIVE
ncbi:MAG TPA: PVC-type heme-binding CxxCH protein, partial [Anditalea sp.]|nr:PVC-type heme-binding CxxCH protein [Anditalea sp.]